MPDLPPLTDSFTQIQDWMHIHAPGVTFRPPADPDAIDNFTGKSNLIVPDGLRELLLIADGETRTSAGMIGNWRFMSIAEVQAAWGLLTQMANKGAFAGLQTETPPYIRTSWWGTSWIPVVGNDAGDYFCLDTDPPELQRTGQVLLFLQESPERPLVAGSLRAWFDRIARDLNAGVYAFDTEAGFNGEAFLWSSLEGKHLLDDIEGKLMVENDSGPQDPPREKRS